MKYKILASLLVCSSPCSVLYAEDSSSQEIRVQLSSTSALSPLYVGKFGGTSSFDKDYLHQLEAVLAFDLSYNGVTKVVPSTEQKEQLLSKEDVKEAFHVPSWKSMGIPYLVKVKITGKTLEAYALSIQTGSLKHFMDVALTGDLNQDRRQIHKLADGVSKALFNKEGIASTRILYAVQLKETKADSGDWQSEIWECDWDGHNARQITKERSYCVTPVLVPASPQYPAAGDRFLYVSYKMGQPKIFIASIKEGVGRRLIDLRGNQLLPAISLQRDKVAFICDANGRSDLFLQPFNPATGEVGKPVQLYSYPRSTQASPTFSPDGSQIAFVSDKDSRMRIYTIPATFQGKRSEAVLLTKQNNENSCPSWSPDGRKLAYSAKTGGIRQIWIYDFMTKEEKQLTFGPGNKENPVWAPDSTHMVFNSTDGSSSELYLVNLNQPDAFKITKGQGKKHYPTWGKR